MITTLHSEDGARVQIAHHGAQVFSWIPAGQNEQLFLSAKSAFDSGASLRGGIPVIFPQFADLGPLPKHGVVRTQEWHCVESAQPGQALFELRDNAVTRAAWSYAFLAQLHISFGGESLEVKLSIHNTGTTPFSFTAALHTYLRVKQIAAVRLRGLQGLTYRDKVTGLDAREMSPQLAITGQTDRIYSHSPAQLQVQEGQHIRDVISAGFTDAVIWNPGVEVSLADMEPGGEQRMLCVEAATISTPVILSPGQCWSGLQRIISPLV